MRNRTIRTCASALVVSSLAFGVTSPRTSGPTDRPPSIGVQESGNEQAGHVIAASRKWWK